MGYKLLVIGQLPPPHHGSNVMTKLFIKTLKNLEFEIDIVEKKFSQKLEEVGKSSFIKIIKIPLITSKLIYQLVKNRYDMCFYFLSIKPPSIFFDTFFLMIIRMFRVKYVLYLHGKGLINLDEKVCQPILRLFVKKSISLSLGALVLGERLKRDVINLIQNEYLFVLPNSILDIKSNKNEFNYTGKNRVKILFLSNLVPSKGPLEFLKMASKIHRIDKKVQFFLAGPNRDKRFFSDIKQFINNEGLNSCVVLTGPVYGEEKEKLFRNSDIFVFPTYYDLECFPLVILESMRAGLPIVSSDEGSIPEIVIDGVNGFIVNPKDIDMLTERVLKLIISPELRIKMGSAGKNIFEKNFTINSYQKRLEQGLEFFFEVKNKSDGESIKTRKTIMNGTN